MANGLPKFLDVSSAVCKMSQVKQSKGDIVRNLHKKGQLSVREIANALGLSTQTVYWHLSKNKGGARGGKANGGRASSRTLRGGSK